MSGRYRLWLGTILFCRLVVVSLSVATVVAAAVGAGSGCLFAVPALVRVAATPVGVLQIVLAVAVVVTLLIVEVLIVLKVVLTAVVVVEIMQSYKSSFPPQLHDGRFRSA